MCDEIVLDLLVRGKGAPRIAGEHMDLMSSTAELMAEVIGDSAGTTDGVREKDVCQHENSHEITHLLYDSAHDIIIR